MMTVKRRKILTQIMMNMIQKIQRMTMKIVLD